MEYFCGLIAFLCDQFIAYLQKPRKGTLDDFVKVLPIGVIARFVAKDTAHGQEALNAGECGARVVGVDELHGIIGKFGPLAGEVAVQDTLEGGNELLSDQRFGRDENGDKPLSDTNLLLFGYQGGLGSLGAGGLVPRTIDAVLDVDDGCGKAKILSVTSGRRRAVVAFVSYWIGGD